MRKSWPQKWSCDPVRPAYKRSTTPNSATLASPGFKNLEETRQQPKLTTTQPLDANLVTVELLQSSAAGSLEIPTPAPISRPTTPATSTTVHGPVNVEGQQSPCIDSTIPSTNMYIQTNTPLRSPNSISGHAYIFVPSNAE